VKAGTFTNFLQEKGKDPFGLLPPVIVLKYSGSFIFLFCFRLQDDSWLGEFLPEAILSLLSVNTRARRVAVKFVAKLCESLKVIPNWQREIDSSEIQEILIPILFFLLWFD